jgi:hypothetical protein
MFILLSGVGDALRRAGGILFGHQPHTTRLRRSHNSGFPICHTVDIDTEMIAGETVFTESKHPIIRMDHIVPDTIVACDAAFRSLLEAKELPTE